MVSARSWLGFWVAAIALIGQSSLAQQTQNSSTLTNNAAPSASSVTTGGTNINYQNNNQWSNEMGFGPGFFCRTPTFYTGGNLGSGNNNNFDQVGTSGNSNSSYSFSFGLLMPFGSTVVEDCKRLVASVVKDREISSELSMLRTCFSLEKEGIVVDPKKYPLLERCAKTIPGSVTPPLVQSRPPASGYLIRPTRPEPQTLPPKIPQVTKS
jgi:hypothetical protein